MVELHSISFLESLEVISRSAQVQKSYIIEEYKDIENNAFDVCNATTTTKGEQKHETLHQNRQIARQLELEAKRNQLVNPKVLKATSRNAAK